VALTAPLVGSTEPRISVVPCGLSHRGAEAVEFAREVLGVELMPWQELVLDRACRTREDNTWTYRTVCAVVPRQVGKSFITGCRIIAGMCLWGERLAIAASQSRDVSIESWRHAVELAEFAELPIKKIMRASGREELVLDIDGREARYKVVTASAGGARGLSCELCVLDEVREFKRFDVWSAIDKTRRARPSSQLWAISTAGTVESVVLDRLQSQGRSAAEAGTVGGPLMYMEWSAPDDLDASDPRAWVAANPALGHTVSAETIAAELATDPIESFECEVLCRRVITTRPWLPGGTWEAATDPAATVPDSAVGEVVLALDASPDLQHASIAVGWPRPDGRCHVELVATFASTLAAETRLHELVSRWQPRTVAVVAKGPVEPVVGRVRAATDVEVMAVSATDLDRASRSFYEAVASSRIVHPPDVVLATAIAGAQASTPGLFSLRSTAVDITGAVSAVLAAWAVDRGPVAAAVPAWTAY
jgi:hypothetical protein